MKMSKSYKVFYVFNIIILLLMCCTMLFPYLNQLAIAFNEGSDTSMGGLTIFPRKFTLYNFSTVLSDPGTVNAAVISILRVVLTVAISIIITFAAAYALTRRDLKGRKVFSRIYMITMYVNAGVIPTYILYRYLGLINNFAVYVLPYTFSFYNMIIMRSFIQELPASLEESALLDGANELVVMFKIIMPLSLPVIATVALWIAVGQWNEYTSTLYYITDKELYTLQYLMMRVIKQGETMKQQMSLNEAMGVSNNAAQQVTTESVKAAMMIVTTLPIICLYPFLQKYFVKGVALGAVKE